MGQTVMTAVSAPRFTTTFAVRLSAGAGDEQVSLFPEDEARARRHVARLLGDALRGGWQIVPTAGDRWLLTRADHEPVELAVTRSTPPAPRWPTETTLGDR